MLYISEAREFLVLRRAGCSFAQPLDTTSWHGMTADRYHTWGTKMHGWDVQLMLVDTRYLRIKIVRSCRYRSACRNLRVLGWQDCRIGQVARTSVKIVAVLWSNQERYEYRQNMQTPFKFGRV